MVNLPLNAGPWKMMRRVSLGIYPTRLTEKLANSEAKDWSCTEFPFLSLSHKLSMHVRKENAL
jgi:hypothetical protein